MYGVDEDKAWAGRYAKPRSAVMNERLVSIAAIAVLGGCATAPPSADQIVRDVALNQTVRLADRAVTPTSVVEDSRCPRGVQCIQAGTVRIAAVIADPGTERTMVLTLGVPARLDGGWVNLVRTCPYPVHGARLNAEDYSFRLSLKRGEKPALVDPPDCPEPRSISDR